MAFLLVADPVTRGAGPLSAADAHASTALNSPHGLGPCTAKGEPDRPDSRPYSEGVGHPIMFRDDDPMLGQIRQIALGFPGGAAKISHGRPAFYTTKIFAYYGGSMKVDGVWVEHAQSLLVLPDRSERRALLADCRVYVPGYLGSYGWIGFDLDGSVKVNWLHRVRGTWPHPPAGAAGTRFRA